MKASPSRLWTFYSDFEKFKEIYIENKPRETTDAMRIGTAVDDIFSYGIKSFFKKYQILASGQKRSNKETQLTNTMGITTWEAAMAYCLDPRMDMSNRRYIMQYKAERNINGVDCHCIADRYLMEDFIIRDFKTTACMGGEIEDFHYTADKWGYYFKMAFYNMIIGGNNKCVLDFYHKRYKKTYTLVIPQSIMDENTLIVQEALVLFKQFLTKSEHA